MTETHAETHFREQTPFRGYGVGKPETMPDSQAM